MVGRKLSQNHGKQRYKSLSSVYASRATLAHLSWLMVSPTIRLPLTVMQLLPMLNLEVP